MTILDVNTPEGSTIVLALQDLEALMDSGDSEAVHQQADEVLLSIVAVFAPEVAEKYRELQGDIIFWYA